MDPNHVHLPGIYVDRITQATTVPQIEFLTLASDGVDEKESIAGTGEAKAKREAIARVSHHPLLVVDPPRGRLWSSRKAIMSTLGLVCQLLYRRSFRRAGIFGCKVKMGSLVLAQPQGRIK